jgi:site-specific DNA recombinase
LLDYYNQLRKNGVSLVSVSENIDDTAQGEYIMSLMGANAQFYSRNLSNEIKKGQRETALQCKHVGGPTALGYDVDPVTRRYVINEYESRIVREVFEQYSDGVGYAKILDYLNSMGFRTKRGNFFAKNSLNSILTNEKYVGLYVYNKRQDEKDCRGKRNPYIRPREEWIQIEDGLPAIVDKETFDKVQARMTHNAARGGRYKAKTLYLLSGLVRCGECGAAMQGNTRKDGRGKSVYSSYDCQAKRNKKSCDSRCVRKENLDNFVLEELYDRVLSEVSIWDITERMNLYSQKISEHGRGDLELAKKEMGATKQKIDKLLRLVLETDVSSETVSEELKRLEDSKVYLERRIDELTINNTAVSFTESITAELLSKSRDIVRSRDLVECRNLMYAFVESVIVFKDSIEVLFKVSVPDDEGYSLVPLRIGQSKEAITEGLCKAG